MKYKIYDFLQDRYFPKSSHIFIPTKAGVFAVLESLILDGRTDKLTVYIYLYEDSSRGELASAFFTYEEFLGYDVPDTKWV